VLLLTSLHKRQNLQDWCCQSLPAILKTCSTQQAMLQLLLARCTLCTCQLLAVLLLKAKAAVACPPLHCALLRQQEDARGMLRLMPRWLLVLPPNLALT
jgi:hypothetical protein